MRIWSLANFTSDHLTAFGFSLPWLSMKVVCSSLSNANLASCRFEIHVHFSLSSHIICCNVRLCCGNHLKQSHPRFLRLSSGEKFDHALGLPGHVHQTVFSPGQVNFTFLFLSLFQSTWYQSRGPHQPRRVTWVRQVQWGRPAACGTSCFSVYLF